MASQRGNKRSHHDNQPKKPPHFFKIVFSPVDRGIKIPYAFMRDYGENLEEVVVLKVPISTGASWPVELLRTEYGTWLDKGWKEFAEHYSIREHHFLVFKYLGDSLFQVIIFDSSASEIEYPFDLSDDSDSIEFLEEFPAAEQGRKSADEINAKQGNAQNLNADVKEEISEGILPCIPGRQCSCNAITETVVDKDKFTSFQRAKAFTSDNPFFIKFMQPSFVTNGYALGFSLSFTKKHLSKLNRFDIDLRVEGKKTWPVTCFVYANRSQMMKESWMKFVLDNHLVVGDVCVFELIEHTRTFMVTIYRRD